MEQESFHYISVPEQPDEQPPSPTREELVKKEVLKSIRQRRILRMIEEEYNNPPPEAVPEKSEREQMLELAVKQAIQLELQRAMQHPHPQSQSYIQPYGSTVRQEYVPPSPTTPVPAKKSSAIDRAARLLGNCNVPAPRLNIGQGELGKHLLGTKRKRKKK